MRFDSTSKIYNFYRVDYPQEFISYLLKNLNLNNEDVCADLGCGSGKFSNRIVKFVKKLDGIDCSKQMLSKTKNLDDSFNPILMDVNNFISPNTYNFIFSSHSFHWFNKKKLLTNIYQSLKNFGYVVIFWNNSLSRKEDWFKEIQDLVKKFHTKSISEHRGLDTLDLLNDTLLFKNISKHEFHFKKSFSIEEYIGMLKTKSYIADDIPKKFQEVFFEEVESILKKYFPDENIIENFSTDVYIGRKII